MIYQFKPAAHLRAALDPQRVGEELERLRALGSGFTPSVVVEAARADDSPLHPHFSWDLSAADALQRVLEDEAKYLIRAVVAVVDEPDGTTSTGPAFVSVTAQLVDGPIYVPVVEALTDDQYRTQVLTDAIEAFVALRNRYAKLEELSRIFTVIDDVAGKARSG